MSNILYGTDRVISPVLNTIHQHLLGPMIFFVFFFVDGDFEARRGHECDIVVEGSVEVRIG